ncbi:MAG: hypothetical protein ETSY1_01570 [Candidatus Entotheonella factor]|uniref:Uncharacterized protein n=1 Tax=Entotheonella factor TaxID=1429438 RepID=W4LYP2_ENTF1|nr:MAG: hypothetical protein ETSY1_01570 [Candidatus Entotheonella factor]
MALQPSLQNLNDAQPQRSAMPEAWRMLTLERLRMALSLGSAGADIRAIILYASAYPFKLTGEVFSID